MEELIVASFDDNLADQVGTLQTFAHPLTSPGILGLREPKIAKWTQPGDSPHAGSHTDPLGMLETEVAKALTATGYELLAQGCTARMVSMH